MSDDGTQLTFFGDVSPSPQERAKMTRLARDAAKRGLSPEELTSRRAIRAEVKATYFVEFKRARNVDHIIFDGADETAIDRLLEKVQWNRAEALTVIKNAYAHSFYRTVVTIRDLARDPAKHQRGEQPGRAHMQRGHAIASRNDRPRNLKDY